MRRPCPSSRPARAQRSWSSMPSHGVTPAARRVSAVGRSLRTRVEKDSHVQRLRRLVGLHRQDTNLRHPVPVLVQLRRALCSSPAHPASQADVQEKKMAPVSRLGVLKTTTNSSLAAWSAVDDTLISPCLAVVGRWERCRLRNQLRIPRIRCIRKWRSERLRERSFTRRSRALDPSPFEMQQVCVGSPSLVEENAVRARL